MAVGLQGAPKRAPLTIAMYNVYVNEGDVYPLRQKFTKGTKIEFTKGKKSKMKCPLREIIHEGENIEFDQE